MELFAHSLKPLLPLAVVFFTKFLGVLALPDDSEIGFVNLLLASPALQFKSLGGTFALLLHTAAELLATAHRIGLHLCHP